MTDVTPNQQAALRDRIAEAVRDAACNGDCGKTEEECAKERIQPFVWHHGRLAVIEGTPEQIAAAVLAVLPTPADRAAEEAYRLALSTALRLGTGANWEAIRDRAEDLVAEVEELTAAKRRLLDQRRPDTDQTAESAPATGHNDSAGDVRPAAIAWDFEGEYEADRWHGIGHTYRNGEHDQALAYLKRRAETDKEHRRIRMVRAATTYTVEAECIPAAAQQPKEA